MTAVGDGGCVVIEDVSPAELSTSFFAVRILSTDPFNEWGRGLSSDDATLGGLMERVERLSAVYAQRTLPIHKLRAGTASENVLALTRFGLTNYQRFLFQNSDIDAAENDYVEVQRWNDGATSLAPASRVFLRYRGGVQDSSCSTGLAAHFDPNEARERAALEALERHFHHVTKFNGAAFLQLDVHQAIHDHRLLDLIQKLEQSGIKVSAYSCDVAAPLRSCWVKVSESKDDLEWYPFGAVFHFATHRSVEKCIERGITECLVSRIATNEVRLAPRRASPYDREFAAVLDAPRGRAEPEELLPFRGDLLGAIQLVSRGFESELYFCELTSPSLGIPVYRALLPDAQPNFDLMGLHPTSPRARITPALKLFEKVSNEVRSGKFQDQVITETRQTLRMPMHSSPLARSKYASIRLAFVGTAVPRPEMGDATPIANLMSQRRTCRRVATSIGQRALLDILEGAVGKSKLSFTGSAGFVVKRNYPSGGSRHPLEFFVEIRRSDDLEVGLYHFDLERQCLVRLPTVEFLRGKNTVNDYNAACVVWMIYLPQRSVWKYRKKAFPLALIEAGHVGQNMCLLAEDGGINAVPLGVVGGQSPFHPFLSNGEVPIYAIALGKRRITHC